jgi:hypothetical protein
MCGGPQSVYRSRAGWLAGRGCLLTHSECRTRLCFMSVHYQLYDMRAHKPCVMKNEQYFFPLSFVAVEDLDDYCCLQ